MRPGRLIVHASLALAAGGCSALPTPRNALAPLGSSAQQGISQPAYQQQAFRQPAPAEGANLDTLAMGREAYAQAPLTLPPPGQPLPPPTSAAPPASAAGPTGFLGTIFGRSRPAPQPAPTAIVPPALAAAPARVEPAPASQPTGFLAAAGSMFGRARADGNLPEAAKAPPPSATMAQASSVAVVVPSVELPAEAPYTLDSGDRLRVVVFGQEGLSNSYFVDAAGKVTIPLIGPVTARGQTPQELSHAIAERLRRGFIREPHVAVEVEVYRPFFILGEVTYPGQYPYVPNMTVETAVAIAGGFSPRAYRWEISLDRPAPGGVVRARSSVPLFTRVRPGDTLVIKERWF